MSSNPGPGIPAKPAGPRPVPSPAKPAAARPTLEALLNALPSDFDRPEPPPGYISALKLAIGIQAFLLIIYLLSMAGFLILCFYSWPKALANAGPLGTLMAFFPALLGFIVLFFMIKPFFWPSQTIAPPVEVTPEEQPILFAYVNRICDLVGAPKPAKIRVTADANASASFENPLTDLVTRRFVLTLGLPLVSGLSLTQLTGVIAHEFGHFNQHAGFLVSTISGWINGSIARIVLQRDQIDELMDSAANSHIALKSLMFIPRFANWINRGVLWLMMVLSYALVSRTFREAEFDADQYSTRIAGTKDFENTFKRIYLLSHGVQESFEHLAIWIQDKRLPDDTVYLSVASTAQMDDKVKKDFLERVTQRPTKWYDTHPCHTERVATALQTPYPALVKFNGPATVLFENYSLLCKKATGNVYQQALGKELSNHRLVSARDMAKEKGSDEEAVKALDRYFQGYYSIFRPVFPRKIDTRSKLDAEKTREAITLIRNRMVSAAHSNVDRLNQLTRLESDLIAAQMAITLMDQGYQINPGSFRIPAGNIGSASTKVSQCQDALATLDKEMIVFDNDVRKRIELALPHLHDDKIMGQMALDDLMRLRSETSRFLTAAAGIESVFPTVKRIGRRMEIFHELFALIMQTDDPGIIQLLIRENQNILADMHRISENLLSVSYPFSLDGSSRTVADYLAEIYPDVSDIGGVISCADSFLAKFKLLTYRLLSKLVLTAEIVETRLGLPLLEAPDANDPLAELSKEVDKKHEKIQEAQQEAQVHADLFYGENARAAAVGILMMVILFYWFIISPFTSPSQTLQASPQTFSINDTKSANASDPDFKKPLDPPYLAPKPQNQPDPFVVHGSSLSNSPPNLGAPSPSPALLPGPPQIASGQNARFRSGQIVHLPGTGTIRLLHETQIVSSNLITHHFLAVRSEESGKSSGDTFQVQVQHLKEAGRILHDAPTDTSQTPAPALQAHRPAPPPPMPGQAENTPSKEQLKPGHRVSTLIGSNWADATVVDRQGDTLTLSAAYPNWPDETYPYASVRIRDKHATGPSDVNPGDAVDVLWGNSWSPARIIKCENDQAVIRWDHQAKTTFKVSVDSITPLPMLPPRAGKTPNLAAAQNAPQTPNPGRPVSVPRSSLTFDDVNVGDTLWVSTGSRWVRGQVTRKQKTVVMIRLENSTVDRAVPYQFAHKEKPE